MKVLVTGSDGQLGYDIIRLLNIQGVSYIGLDRKTIDLRDMSGVANLIRTYSPDVIIHCAAYTNVDLAEREPEICRLINVDGTANIAKVSQEIGSKLVYISTDYVFSGEGSKPYDIDSTKSPLSVYGRTKLDGENEVIKRTEQYFIIRTSWSFGINGKNFVNAMLNLGKKQRVVDVVKDQIGSPTYTLDLSSLIIEMINTDKYGIYHATNEGYCSRAEFAKEIFRQAGIDAEVNSISSDEYSSLAVRPKNSRLSKSSLDFASFKRLPKWEDSLSKYLLEFESRQE
ncbi:MAG: dTDP-4-dehydrorhamnose reductase [Paenibacillus macerans]|uniref:dTDP-4-dehydrorhamnose reductase n=1 Tax=Paenibacillus macerans TaxID=44252 RepID=UPI001B27EB55|nr:dTDP-4-dehydrorhamnose reductase [Paenibacillus macerans]MDU7473082.1 dTDP-4-dehydrorhamnose reductase [Paenibacillus macerans]GIP08704.1 NAD(P)-dependent oxidoreductase [Paenibacillus macerans]